MGTPRQSGARRAACAAGSRRHVHGVRGFACGVRAAACLSLLGGLQGPIAVAVASCAACNPIANPFATLLSNQTAAAGVACCPPSDSQLLQQSRHQPRQLLPVCVQVAPCMPCRLGCMRTTAACEPQEGCGAHLEAQVHGYTARLIRERVPAAPRLRLIECDLVARPAHTDGASMFRGPRGTILWDASTGSAWCAARAPLHSPVEEPCRAEPTDTAAYHGNILAHFSALCWNVGAPRFLQAFQPW